MELRKLGQALQIGATYMGTIVGAGFATGQEIMQFFTRFGAWGTIGIPITALLLIWSGSKVMLLSSNIGAHSYEDLNKKLFGERWGSYLSYFMLIILLCVSAVMLAGAGTIFHEHAGLPYQIGLLATAVLCFFILRRGMSAIMAVNSIVVPLMLIFSCIIIWHTLKQPTLGGFSFLPNQLPSLSSATTAFLYAAFNLTLAQAVLVPLGSHVKDKKTIICGAWIGGIGIGLMLMTGHLALTANMPQIQQYAIPMGVIAGYIGSGIQLIYLFVIYAEIFTTLLADVYGVSLQLQQRFRASMGWLTVAVLVFCYAASQIGFGTLLSFLYPLFGFLSLGWFIKILLYRSRT